MAMKKALTVAIAMALSPVALAATQGNLGSNSSGDLDITLDIQELIMVSGLSDVTLPAFNGGVTDSTGTVNFCVYRNSSVNSAYNIQMDDGVSDADYQLNGPLASTLSYTVEVNSINVPEGVVTANAAFVADNTSTNCGGTPNTTLDITVSNGDMQTAEPGTYTGTLYMTVQPI